MNAVHVESLQMTRLNLKKMSIMHTAISAIDMRTGTHRTRYCIRRRLGHLQLRIKTIKLSNTVHY